MLSVRRLLDNKKINSVWSVRPDHMVIDALALMSQQGIGAVLVMDEDQLIGIFSEVPLIKYRFDWNAAGQLAEHLDEEDNTTYLRLGDIKMELPTYEGEIEVPLPASY